MEYYVLMVGSVPYRVETDKAIALEEKPRMQKKIDLQEGCSSSWERKKEKTVEVHIVEGPDREQSTSIVNNAAVIEVIEVVDHHE